VSFHSNLARWRRWCELEHCPVCRDDEPPGDVVTIRETAFSWLEAHPRVCLPGTCYVLAKTHAVELYDLAETDLLGFMRDVQTAARALKKITGALKINYEIHGNTVPHLHMHLFPRTLDDPFSGGPIQYDRIDPPVYTKSQFDAFVDAMRRWFAHWEDVEGPPV
jgi:diadenosine tetraphosphate (Ap4A) HIT family hydrolase